MCRTLAQIMKEWKPQYDEETSNKYSKIVSSCFDELRHDDHLVESSNDFFAMLAEMIAEESSPTILKTDPYYFFEELFLLLREVPKPAREKIYDYFTDEETLDKKAAEKVCILDCSDYTVEYDELVKEQWDFYNFLENHSYVN